MTEKVNVYDIYGICYDTSSKVENMNKHTIFSSGDIGFSKVGNQLKAYRKHYTAADYTSWATHKLLRKNNETHRVKNLPPCTFGQPIIDYLNSADVREALHIAESASAWDLCNDTINENYARSRDGSQWIYQALKGKYKILFYSGDTDGAVPTLGSVNWINDLNWDVKQPYGPYFYN